MGVIIRTAGEEQQAVERELILVLGSGPSRVRREVVWKALPEELLKSLRASSTAVLGARQSLV